MLEDVFLNLSSQKCNQIKSITGFEFPLFSSGMNGAMWVQDKQTIVIAEEFMRIFNKRPKYALSDILKGIHNAVNSAQEMLQAQQVQNLSKFWKPNDGTPVTQKLKLGERELSIPLISLVSHSHLEMDDVEILRCFPQLYFCSLSKVSSYPA